MDFKNLKLQNSKHNCNQRPLNFKRNNRKHKIYQKFKWKTFPYHRTKKTSRQKKLY